MKNQADPNRLLDDILEDTLPASLRAELLQRTLCQVRRQNSVRRLNRAGLAIVFVMGLALTLWRFSLPLPQQIESRPTTFGVVSSEALDPSMIVETRLGSVNVISSSASTVVLVETGSGRDMFNEVDDQQLLAFLSGSPAALVRQGPHQAELMFLNPEDRNGFLIR